MISRQMNTIGHLFLKKDLSPARVALDICFPFYLFFQSSLDSLGLLTSCFD